MDNNIKTVTNYTLPDGSVYSGECIENGNFIELVGKGIIKYPNGDYYKGDFEGGFARGHGIYTFSDGEHHEGRFYDGIPEGVGLHIYSNGDTYIGEFVDGNRTGLGLYLKQRGRMWFGKWSHNEFKDDMTHLTRMVSDFARDTLIMSKISGMNGYYWGEERNNSSYPILGIFFLQTGEVFIGKLLNGMRTNYGILFTNGERIDGIWECDKKIADY